MKEAREVLARELYAWGLGLDRPPTDMKRPPPPFYETADRLIEALGEVSLRIMPAEEIEESANLRERMGELLTRTANALKGAPPPRTLHDWSDLPEVAERMVRRLA